ncbi:MAG: phage major capsid protein [Candidatus Omnitrophica bacterium]|nr:phage major capsid protein [Candidatus Omnitrophota bacterium]
MALSLTQIQAVTNDYFLNKMATDNIFDDSVLLWILMSGSKFQDTMVQPGETVDGGEKIRVPLEYAKSHSGAYGNTTLIPQSKKDIINAARFRWAGVYGSNAIDLNEQVQNTGSQAIVNLVQAKLNSINKSARDDLGTDVYSAAATADNVLGLGDLFNTTTSTAYGEIAEDDMATWKANVDTDGGAITYKIMQEIRRTAQVGQNKNKKPDLYITTDLLKDGYERTLQANVRYKDEKMANAGFDNVLFGGVPVVADDKQTAGYMDGLNTRFLNMKTHKDYPFTKPIWEYDKEQPDTMVANTRWIGQLVTDYRAAHARFTGLTEPA